MSNRIDEIFGKLAAEGEKAFVAYVCGGDPTREKSLEILCELANVGVDVIELGVPFSDPMADGVVNQMAADRALKAGMDLCGILDLVRDFRKVEETPLVLFTYLNPIYAYGYERFHVDAAAAGVDGILLLDLPPDEVKRNAEFAGSEGLHHIHLIAPTTPEGRKEVLARSSQGFVYALSRTGVTGAHGAPCERIGELVAEIKKFTKTPVCVGFGITTSEQAAEVAAKGDGVIVGSAIVRMVEKYGQEDDCARRVGEFVRPLVEATHGKF